MHPTGGDPRSGFQEFAILLPHLSVPTRDPDSGELLVSEDATLVLVLLPGGRTTMGAQRTDPEAPFYDSMAKSHEQPTVEHELLPFLVSKFEVTQAQWLAVEDSVAKSRRKRPGLLQPVPV